MESFPFREGWNRARQSLKKIGDCLEIEMPLKAEIASSSFPLNHLTTQQRGGLRKDIFGLFSLLCFFDYSRHSHPAPAADGDQAIPGLSAL